jgi:hypothetical protein
MIEDIGSKSVDLRTRTKAACTDGTFSQIADTSLVAGGGISPWVLI